MRSRLNSHISIPDQNNSPVQSTKQLAHAIDVSAKPLEWPEVALGHARIELEIGSGKGLFLVSAAQSRPESRFVGIELACKFADRAAQRIATAGLTNAVILRGDAERIISDIVPDRSIDALHVYFPDPWWRRKHKKRRVLNDQSLRRIEQILMPHGELHFWTDVLDYYELICGQLMERPSLSGPHFVPERVARHDMDYTTHFERRARRNGQPIYRALFRKVATD